MKTVVLDGSAMNPGDLSWDWLGLLGEWEVWERSTAEEAPGRIGGAEAIICNKVLIDRALIAACPSLRYVGLTATGYNTVDLAAARERGIVVTNVPAYSTASVAQLVFAFILEIACHVQSHSDSVHRGDWVRSPDFCYWNHPLMELSGKSLGIWGYGSIGQEVARIAVAFGMKPLVYTRHSLALAPPLEEVSEDELYRRSDIISLHCPLTPETRGRINSETIEKMKDGAILVNTARGPLVLEHDVRRALESGKLGAFGADVVSEEPMKAGNPLIGAPNCLITPHIAWASLESRTRLMRAVEENLRAFLKGRPLNRVS